MVIVEGPDGSGKTTLIRQLSTALALPVAPRVVAQDTTAMVDIDQWVEENLSGGFQFKLLDRHRLFSEPIYSRALNRSSSEKFKDPAWFGKRYAQFHNLKPIVILCLPSFDTVKSNLVDDPDNQVIFPHIESIYSAYQLLGFNLHDQGWRYVQYDYTKPGHFYHILGMVSYLLGIEASERSITVV